jgi:hypothetical protein
MNDSSRAGRVGWGAHDGKVATFEGRGEAAGLQIGRFRTALQLPKCVTSHRGRVT